MKKRLLSLLLAVAAVLSIFVVLCPAASAVTADTVLEKLARLQQMMPEGTYWNHKGVSYSTYNSNREKYNFSSTTTPCSHYSGHCSSYNYSGQCGCNSFDGSTQCMGFARMVCTHLFGDTPNGSGYADSNWKSVTFERLRPGDYIRYGNHSVVVADVNRLEGYIIVAECNGNGTCDISWDRVMYKSSFSGRSPRYLQHVSNEGHPYCNSFTDMPAYGSETHRALDFLLQEGLFNGASGTTIDPTSPLTRAQVAVILYRLADRPDTAGLTDPGYTDVPQSAWFHKEALWANANGLMVGTGKNQFSPGQNITNEMLLTVLYRFAQWSGAIEATSSATDLSGLSVSGWAQAAYRWALDNRLTGRISGNTQLNRGQFAVVIYRYCFMIDGHTLCTNYTDMPAYGTEAHDALDFALKKGFINGVSATSVNPAGSLTRAQLATVLYRMAGSPAEEVTETPPFTDIVPSSWYYDAVAWAYSAHIINGTSATAFSPVLELDYQTVITVLFRFAGDRAGSFNASLDLNGLSVSGWAADAYRWALSTGLIDRVSGTDKISRGDFAIVIYRYAQKIGL